MTKKPGIPVRGSKSGRPIMVLLDFFGQRWTLRILWELRNERASFRQLQARCGDISPTILNSRLKVLRNMLLIDVDDSGYGLTKRGQELGLLFAELNCVADKWAASLVAL